ncbi:alpha/beta hydrolase fold domain-containing protein [Frankia sp. AiPa1]|uniref:alpha/beta hydrolase fold domain-containing protein n=1 Tax=Frankia sp. AiPa1 TaxID=573492 RepID=UPI00202B11FE|nr:alpha/beta hydrolase fold domain-containing protein [Frankia sp. AiPa1]MCL9760063.1 alpha/beta hydrolase [Frankia sp. AiPa1]
MPAAARPPDGAPPPAIDVRARVEPGTVAALDRLARWDLTSVATIRASYAAVAAPPAPPTPGVMRTDATIAGVDGRPDVRVRWYRPDLRSGADPGLAEAGADTRLGAVALPCLLWLHGGAYVMGTLDENDDRLERMVLELGCAIVSVDWRLAPEHPYPQGLDDAATVWARLVEDPAAHGVDPDRLVVGGASAGAGLAAALCLRLRAAGSPQPALQLLIYPMLDDRELTASIRASEAPGHWGLWHLRANRLCWGAYLSDLLPAVPAGNDSVSTVPTGDPPLAVPADGDRAPADPAPKKPTPDDAEGTDEPGGWDIPACAAPARATDLAGLAPAYLCIGDVDAFLDENLDYAARLARAGTPVELHVYPGVIHGGFGTIPRTPRTAQLLRDVYAALATAFGSSGPSAGDPRRVLEPVERAAP